MGRRKSTRDKAGRESAPDAMRALEVVLVRPSNTTPWGLHCGILEGSTELLVRRAVACSCAAKARPRLREGDRIVAVDGRPTAVVDDLEDVLPYFREAAGTCLRLAVSTVESKSHRW